MKIEQMLEHCTVERTRREIIEHQLLVSLQDKSKVALLMGKQNLEDMITALHHHSQLSGSAAEGVRCGDMCKDLLQLYREAFP